MVSLPIVNWAEGSSLCGKGADGSRGKLEVFSFYRFGKQGRELIIKSQPALHQEACVCGLFLSPGSWNTGHVVVQGGGHVWGSPGTTERAGLFLGERGKGEFSPWAPQSQSALMTELPSL